jgi:hypothetical protein
MKKCRKARAQAKAAVCGKCWLALASLWATEEKRKKEQR